MSSQRRLVWLKEALLDLDRLHDFVQLKSPTAAAKVAKRILEAANKLTAHPFLGRPVKNITPQFRDLFVSFGKAGYVLRYTIKDDTVIVVKSGSHAKTESFKKTALQPLMASMFVPKVA